MRKKIAIIGAGPAGMMAAYFAAKGGAEVFLYDKNPTIGKKLTFVPWDGCEISHTGDTEDFMENYARGANFLKYSFEKFGNKELSNFFKKMGVELETAEDGTVSPVGGESASIQQAFEKELVKLGVNFCISSKVQNVVAKSKKIVGLQAHNLEKEFDKIIIATGGAARPKLGASGDGYEFANSLGHSIVEPKPAMADIDTEERLGRYLKDLEISPVTIGIYNNHSKFLERSGNIIFTDHGVSGDTIRFLSGTIARLLDKGKVELGLDFYPQANRDQLERELKAESSLSSRYSVGEILRRYVPERMMPLLTRFCRIHDTKPMSHITNLERKGLLLFVKDFRLVVKRVKPFYEALYTSGGVDTSEINPKTMESNLVKGLYFCGEILDVDGGPGGYNLHSAFSTGYLAGKSASRGAKAQSSVKQKTEEEAEEKPAKKKKAKTAKKKAVKKTAKKKAQKVA